MKERKGFTLVLVIAMMSILTATAIMLWSTTNTSMLISANHRRHVQANGLAASGISHNRVEVISTGEKAGSVSTKTATFETFYNEER